MSKLLLGLSDRRSISLVGRLKVACYLWKEEEGILPILGKKKVLLRWVCQEICLVYDKRAKGPPSSPSAICKLWKFLSVILRAIEGEGENKSEGELTDLSPLNTHLLQGVIAVFSTTVIKIGDEGPGDAVAICAGALECLLNIFQLSQFPPAFSLFETMVSLLETLLTLGVVFLSHAQHYLLHLDLLCPILSSLLPYYNYLVSTQGNQKKAFASTCRQLLLPVLRFKATMAQQRLYLEQQRVGRLDVIGLDYIVLSLFSSDHLSEYSSTLSSAMSGQTASSVSVHSGSSLQLSISSTRVLFDVLETSLKDECDSAIVAGSLSLLLSSFLAENGKSVQVPKIIEFRFFSKILHLLGIQDESALNSTNLLQVNPSSEKLQELAGSYVRREGRRRGKVGKRRSRHEGEECKMVALRECLDAVLLYDVYQVAEDMSSGQTHTAYLQLLASFIMEEIHPRNLVLCFDVVAVLLKLNHLLVEPWLPLLWIVVPMATTPTSTDEEVEASNFMNACIEMYSRLRQLPLLLEKRLDAIQLLASSPSTSEIAHQKTSPLTPGSPASLSWSVQQLLGHHIASLPPGQATDVLHSHIKHLQGLLQIVSSLSKRNKDRTSHSGGTGEEDKLPAWGTAEYDLTFSGYSFAVLQSVGALGMVLCHTPMSMWVAGRSRDKAMELLETLVDNVAVTLMGVAKLAYRHSCLLTASLFLTSECCQIISHLHLHLPSSSSSSSLSLPKWPLSTSWKTCPSLPLLNPLPAEWLTSESELHPPARYLLRKLAILQIRCAASGGVDAADFKGTIDFVFSFKSCQEPSLSWSGQLLSLVAENFLVGCWSLLFSHLPYLYEYCTEEHLRRVTSTILSALEGEGGERGQGEGVGMEVDMEVESSRERLSLRALVDLFLCSEAFLEMRKLQVLLLTCCLERGKTKKLPKPLSVAMKLSASTDSDGDSDCKLLANFPAVLKGVLEHGMDMEASPCKYDHVMLHRKQEMYLKLLLTVPLVGIRPTLLLKCFLQGMVYHVATMLNLLAQTSSSSSPSSFADLVYVLLHILKTATGGKKKLKKKFVFVPGLSDLLFKWWYMCRSCLDELLSEHSDQCQINADKLSIMVAMEITLEMRITGADGGYPLEFIQMLLGDLVDPTKNSCLVAHVLLIISEVACRGLKAGRVGNCLPLGHLCSCILEVFVRLVRDKGIVPVLHTHFYLLSFLAHVIAHSAAQCSSCICGPGSTFGEELSKLWSCKVTDFIVDLISSCLVGECFLKLPPTLDQTIAVLDSFIVMVTPNPANTHTLTKERENKQEEEIEIMEVDVKISPLKTGTPKTSLPSIWNLFKTILVPVFENWLMVGDEDVFVTALLMMEEFGAVTKKSFTKYDRRLGVREDEKLVPLLVWVVVLNKIFYVVCHILNAMDPKDVIATATMEMDKKEITDVPALALVFCLIWLGLIGYTSSLRHDIRTLLGPHLHQVLGLCCSMVKSHSTSTHAHCLLVLGTHLMGQIMSLPSQGFEIDSTQVMRALQVDMVSSASLRLLRVVEVTTDLLAAVIRQHTSTVITTPGPFLVTMNRLLRIVLRLGQEQEEIPYLTTLLHCSSMVSRIIEIFSRQHSLYKFFAYVLHEFLTVSQDKPLHEEVTQVLLPGVFALIKGCTPTELAFLQASLEPRVRESFQGIMTKFDRSYKFGGRM